MCSRYPTGGVVLGGCRLDNDWTGDVDETLVEDIKQRCCALAPELGKPEDLNVIYHAVGLRRKTRFYLALPMTNLAQRAGLGVPELNQKPSMAVW